MSSNTNIGNTPVNQGYVQLIHTGETGGIDGTLRTLYDGDGTASDLQIASNAVKISTQLYIGSKTITEYVQDVVGDMFTTGSYTNITTTYDDINGNIDLNATGAVSGITGGTGIDATGSGNITIAIDSTVATKTYVDTEVAGLVDSAPGTLDTLNELAAALGDDPNFATTTATNIATKLAKASNLSDLTNAETARTNLGLGTGAILDTAAVSDGATTLATGNAIYDHVTTRISGKVDNTRQILTVSGSGLSGGGDLTANRSLSLDVNNLQGQVPALELADKVAIYDNSVGETNVATLTQLKAIVNTDTNQLTTFNVSGDSGTDQTISHGNTLTISGGNGITTSTSATDIVSVALGGFNSLTLQSSPDAQDLVVIEEAIGGAIKKVRVDTLTSTDVTLAGSLDYITLSGQTITRNAIDLTTDVTGILPVGNGGTGLTSISTLLNSNVTPTSLGLVIGTDVQAYDAGLQSISGLTTAADKMIYTTASDTYAVTALTSTARTLLDDTSIGAMQTTLGLGTLATQNTIDFDNIDGTAYIDSEEVFSRSDSQLMTATAIDDLILDKGYGTGTMSSWTLQGDSGANRSVTENNVVDIAGGTGISTEISLSAGVDIATINLDASINDLSDVVITSVSNGQVLKYSSAAGAFINQSDDTGISFSGSTANGLLTYGNSTTADVESELTYNGAGQLEINRSGSNAILQLRSDTNNTRIHFKEGSDIAWNIGYDATNNWFSFYDSSVPATPVKIKDGAGSDTLVVDSTSRVGIGTGSPSNKLEAYGTDAGLVVHYQGNSRGGIHALSTQRIALATTSSADDLVFGYGGSPITSAGFVERMRIDNGTGNVGIGTQSPSSYKLQFGNAGDKIGVDLSSGGTTRIAEIEFYNGADGSLRLKTDNASAGGIEFHTQGSQRMEVLSGGNIHINNSLGIGTTSPASKLHIDDSTNYNMEIRRTSLNGIKLEAGSGSPLTSKIKVAYNDFSYIDAITIVNQTAGAYTQGNVGIGTTAPGQKLEVNGSIRISSDNQKLIIGANSDLELFAHDPAGDSRINVNNNPLLITYNGADRFRMNSTSLIINEGGGDYNFRVEGDTDANLLFVDAGTDRVGIGTASPAYKLDVNGDVRASGDLRASDDIILDVNANYIFLRDASGTLTRTFGMNASNNTYIGPIDAYAGGSILYGASSNVADQIFYTSGTERLRIKATTGNVGIGYTNPAEKLSVNGSILIPNNTHFKAYNSAGTPVPVFRFNSSNQVEIVNGNSSNGDIILADATTTNMIIKGDTGNVGIGTQSPDAKLEVTGSTNSDLFSLEGAGTSMKLVAESGDASTGNVMVYRIGMEYLGTYTNGFIDFYRGGAGNNGFLTFGTSGTEKMRIDGSGNVGIGGVPEGNAKLDIKMSGVSQYLKLERSSSSGRAQIQLANESGTELWRFGLTGGGSEDFEFWDGSFTHLKFDRSANSAEFGGSVGINVTPSGTSGRLDCSNDVVAYSTSDKRLKENIKPLDSALDKVLKINGVEFDWKELTEEEKKTIHGNEGHDVGVLAQEIEEVLPEVVTTRDSGYKAVKYEKIVPLLIEAIKEQQKQIEELKNG